MIASKDRLDFFPLSIGIKGFLDLGQFNIDLFAQKPFPFLQLHVMIDQDHALFMEVFIGREAPYSDQMFPFWAESLIIAPIAKRAFFREEFSVRFNLPDEL